MSPEQSSSMLGKIGLGFQKVIEVFFRNDSINAGKSNETEGTPQSISEHNVTRGRYYQDQRLI